MSELQGLLESVSETIRTYREDELPTPDADHVGRWLYQFNQENHLPFLKEFNHVIKRSFFTKAQIEKFLGRLAINEKLAGKTPEVYWKNTNFLKIQIKGQSQKEMLKIFDGCLKENFGFGVKDCGDEEGEYVYLDDVLFSGGRIGTDLVNWIENKAPQRAKVQIIIIALHEGGRFALDRRLNRAIAESKKDIKFTFWRAKSLENRKFYKQTSNILWPVDIPNNEFVKRFMAMPNDYPFEPRVPKAKNEQAEEPFTSEEGRHLLEQEFLIAGSKIIAQMDEVPSYIRPLGFSNFGIGFGSTIATYRNCPNNSPLALWWGDPHETSGPLNWYPLLARDGYSSARNVFRNLLDDEL